jgi:hypothetical protein
MNNHYHIVVRIDAEQVKTWSDEEVAKPWMRVFTGPLLMYQFLSNADLTAPGHDCVAGLFNSWCDRLRDLTWFMLHQSWHG